MAAKDFVAVALVCALAGCADEAETSASLAPYDPEEVQAASSAYVDCLAQSMRQLDDGKLSPIGLALKIKPLCEIQFSKFEALTVQANDPRTGRAIRENLEQNNEEFITRFVLRERLDRELPP